MIQQEAMACGLTIIHITKTGVEDIVRDGINSFCIPIRDVEAINGEILFFYDNPDRPEMGKNTLERAKTSLPWDNYGKRTLLPIRKS